MGKTIVNQNVFFSGDLVMKNDSKIYMTGMATPNPRIFAHPEKLDKMPGLRIDGNLVLEPGEILIVNGSVIGTNKRGGSSMKAGCVVKHITKEEFQKAIRENWLPELHINFYDRLWI